MSETERPRIRVKVDQNVLKTLLHYDPETGVFTWLAREATTSRQRAWNTRYAGKEAGCPWATPSSNTQYRVIHIFDKPYLGHRLAVLYMTGKWPEHHADHEDRDGLNNRWENIREATSSQNGANSCIQKNNTSGFKGVVPRRNNRWSAELGGKYLGTFGSPEEAAQVYAAAALLKYGEFARLR